MNQQQTGLVLRQTSSLGEQGDWKGGEREGRVEGKGVNGLIGLSCEQGKNNVLIAPALSRGPNPCIH